MITSSTRDKFQIIRRPAGSTEKPLSFAPSHNSSQQYSSVKQSGLVYSPSGRTPYMQYNGRPDTMTLGKGSTLSSHKKHGGSMKRKSPVRPKPFREDKFSYSQLNAHKSFGADATTSTLNMAPVTVTKPDGGIKHIQ